MLQFRVVRSTPFPAYSSITAHHNRQRLKHDLVPFVMPHEPSLQNPLEPLQPRQLPPLVDPHDAALVDPHHHPGPVPFARLVVDGVLIPGAPGRVLDRVQDVGEVGAEGFAVGFAEVVGADGGDGLEGVDELVGAAVGGVEADELGDAGRVVRIGKDVGFGEVGEAVSVRVELLEGLFEKQGYVFAGGDLHGGERGGDLFRKGFDGVFRLGGHVVDEGAKKTPFFERGGHRLGLVRCGDGVPVACYDFEKEVHVIDYFVVGGAAVEGAGAEGVDGRRFAGGGGRMRDCAFEGNGRGFVDEV